MKILIVGNRGGTNVAEGFEKGAVDMGINVHLIESRRAMEAQRWVRTFNWRLRGRRPTRLRQFSEELVETCSALKPDAIVATGLAPVTRRALEQLAEFGIKRLNYLTDDPWNPAHRAAWFQEALPCYDVVFSPRRANIADLRATGVPTVRYLPFAYRPDLHLPEESRLEGSVSYDVIFAGGGDRGRAPVIGSLTRAGFRVALYGSLWNRYGETRGLSLGQADVPTLRRAHSDAHAALCLVRRANRDGHTMRTFELGAMGACILAEYTEEHREIFGEDGETVVYFRSEREMIERLRWLLDHPEERQRLRAAVHARITGGRNTYRDRLETILSVVQN